MATASPALPVTRGRSLAWPRILCRPWVAPAIAATAIGALYVREANPAVGGGNSGEFQVMAHLLGIAHPPSYPLYLLLAKLVSLLPLPGDVAWRINVLTALLGAAAAFLAGLLVLVLYRGQYPRAGQLGAAVAAATVGVMPRLWTLAVEAEVFTLHLCLVLGFWLALLKWQRAGHESEQHRLLLLTALLGGLGLSNHRTFLFFAAAGALFVLLVRPRSLLRPRLVAGVAALAGVGLLPYAYVLRGLVMPMPYFSPTDVHRLSRSDVWYVLQGNAAGETGSGEVVLKLFADSVLLDQRLRWLGRHVAAQFGVLGGPLMVLGAAGILWLCRLALRWTSTGLLSASGAAVFAMSYAKYPDADRYLLPLQTLFALGLAVGVAAVASAAAAALDRDRTREVGRAAGALSGALIGGYVALSAGVLAGSTDFTRGGYVHHTLHNLQGLEKNAVACSWWASSWGWWYAQYVDGVRPDVTLVPKGPDDCLRDVLPAEFGRRAVYFPALTERMRASEYAFFPSRDMWLVVARRAPLREGALLKGPDERIFFYDGSQRRWIPSLDVFTARDLSWDAVQLTPDYVLKDIPEGPPLTSD